MSSQVKSAEPVGGKTADKVFKGVAYACGILILVVLAAVAVFLLFRAWPLIGGDQQANSETISNFTGGKASNFWTYVGPLLFGTVLVSALSLSSPSSCRSASRCSFRITPPRTWPPC